MLRLTPFQKWSSQFTGCLHQRTGRINCKLADELKLSLRNNRLKLKTAGESPSSLEEYNLWNTSQTDKGKNRKITNMDLEH